MDVNSPFPPILSRLKANLMESITRLSLWPKTRCCTSENDLRRLTVITHCNLNIFCCLLIKDILTEEANEPQAVATLVPLEESSEEQQVEELSSDNNLDANKEIRGVGMPERSSKSKAVLMSDEELAETLQKEAKEEQEVEDRDLQEEEAGKEEGKERPVEMSEDDEETRSDKLDMEDAENEADEDEEEDEKDSEMLDKEEIDVEMMPFEGNLGKHAQEREWTEERRVLFEKSDGSSESEIPADLDYAADSGLLQALQTPTPPKQPDASLLLEPDGKEQQSSQEEPPTASDDGEVDGRQASRHDEERLPASKDASAHEQDHKINGITPDLEENSELFMSKTGGKEEQKSGHHSMRKTKKQKKNHRERKHFPQSEQPQPGQEASRQESESSSAEDIGSKAKRRRPGKRVLEPSAF